MRYETDVRTAIAVPGSSAAASGPLAGFDGENLKKRALLPLTAGGKAQTRWTFVVRHNDSPRKLAIGWKDLVGKRLRATEALVVGGQLAHLVLHRAHGGVAGL